MSSQNVSHTRRRYVAIAVVQLTVLLCMQMTAFARGLRNGKEIGDYCYGSHRGMQEVYQCIDDGCNIKYGPGSGKAGDCSKNGKREIRRIQLAPASASL